MLSQNYITKNFTPNIVKLPLRKKLFENNIAKFMRLFLTLKIDSYLNMRLTPTLNDNKMHVYMYLLVARVRGHIGSLVKLKMSRKYHQ